MLFDDPALEAQRRHEVVVGVGAKLVVVLRYCRTQRSFPWCTSLLRSRGYDGYRNIWRGQWDHPSQIYSHVVAPHPVLYSAPGLLPLVWPLAPCATSCVGCYLVGFAALLC